MLRFLSRFKPCNDDGVERAIMLACLADPRKYLGGRACIHKGRLVVTIYMNHMEEADAVSFFSNLDKLFLRIPRISQLLISNNHDIMVSMF